MNAVIYARYSSDKQTEQSIEGQLRVCEEYAEREGYTILGKYIDRALSGKSADRPQFQKMIEDSKSKEFQFVLVYKLDRFSRNRFDSATYKMQLKKNGVRVVSATENITDSPESVMLEALLEAQAEYFSRELSQKVRRGMKETALKAHCTGSVPLGYKVGDDHKLAIDDKTKEIPQIVFHMYADGEGKKQIAEYLNKKGYRTDRGSLFTSNSFANMLSNKKYIGIFSYNKGEIEVEDGCPALVTPELFNKVQEMIAKRRKAPGAKKAKVEYLLSGKLFCGHCGTSMVGEKGTSRSGASYHYYACRKKKKEHSCKKLNERKDYLEWYVCEQVLAFLNLPEHQDKVAAKIVEAYKKEFMTSGIPELETRLARVNQSIDKTVNMLLETDSKALIGKLNELELQRDEIESDLSQARIAIHHIPTEKEIKDWLNNFHGLDPLNLDHQRLLIDVFINCVYLWDDRITVCFNLKGCQHISHIDLIREFERAMADKLPGSDLSGFGEPNRIAVRLSSL